MLIQYGKILTGPWNIAEVNTAANAEKSVKRLCGAIPGIFKNFACELFVPIVKRDLDVFELEAGNLIYIRSNNLKSLWRIKSVTGVHRLVTAGETGFERDLISVPDEWVQERIAACEKLFNERSQGIAVGDFVRLIGGEIRDVAGTVIERDEVWSSVLIELKTKQLLVVTPTKNLLPLGDVPADKRVWYYSALLLDNIEPGQIAEDVHWQYDPRLHAPMQEEPVPENKRMKRARENSEKVQSLRKLQLPTREIAKQVGISQALVRHYVRKTAHTPLTQLKARAVAVARLVAEGKNYRQIATLLKITVGQAEYARNRQRRLMVRNPKGYGVGRPKKA